MASAFQCAIVDARLLRLSTVKSGAEKQPGYASLLRAMKAACSPAHFAPFVSHGCTAASITCINNKLITAAKSLMRCLGRLRLAYTWRFAIAVTAELRTLIRPDSHALQQVCTRLSCTFAAYR